MNKVFSWKSIVATLVGTGVAISTTFPVRSNEYSFAESTANAELVSNQIFDHHSSQNTKSTDNLNNIIGLLGLAIGTGVIGHQLTRGNKPSLTNSFSSLNHKDSSLLAHVSPKLRRELLQLVHNQQIANRLLSGTLNSHPNRSANWLAEKVIYDFKRDQ